MWLRWRCGGQGHAGVLAFEFLVLTAGRSGEVRGARRREVGYLGGPRIAG